MLTCTRSFWTWTFRIEGAALGNAEMTFDWLTEQGTLTVGTEKMRIRKHGMMSGRWSLELDSEVIAEAHKPNPLVRRFHMTGPDLKLTIQARSMFGRTFDIFSGDKVIGEIRPAHFYTHRTHIKCSDEVPELAQMFAFWLAALTWKRRSKNNG